MRFLNCLILVVMNIILCEGQTVFNTQTISGRQNDYIGSHALDPLGNKYLNIFTDGDTLITIYGKTYTLGAGNYILRFDPSDSLTLIYDQLAVAPDANAVKALAADRYGNLYVASEYYDYYSYSFNFMYSKLGPDGKIIWQVKEFVDVSVTPEQILIDDQGNSYVAGYIESVLFFGVRLYKSVVYPAHDFLLKFSPSGNLEWIRTSDASDYDVIMSAMRFDNQGNIIVGGAFHSQIKIGSTSLTNTLGDNYSNMYMTCVTPSGDFQWLKGFVVEGNFEMSDLEVDKMGDFYFCGSFRGVDLYNSSGNVGSSTFGNVTLQTSPWGSPNFFMCKLSSDFEIQWIKFKDRSIENIGPYNNCSYLVNTNSGVIVSGLAHGGFQIDNLALPSSENLQAFVAKLTADGSPSWLKGYGDALLPGTNSFWYKTGYQLSKITDECYFISGNFAKTLNTSDGVITAKSTDIFTGIFTESSNTTIVDLGPTVSKSFCNYDTTTISLNSTLGTNYFSVVQGTLPTVTFTSDTTAKMSNIAYGITKFKWIVRNCTSVSSKLIAINRMGEQPQVKGSTNFCKSELNNAVVTVTGANVNWYDNESLSNQIASGNVYKPTVSETVYVRDADNTCGSKPTQIIISVMDNPQPPTGRPIQPFVRGMTIADLVVSGTDLKWYSSSGDVLSPSTFLENDLTYFATQTVSNCESQRFPVKVSVIASVTNYDPSLQYYPNPVKDNLIISFDNPLDQVVVKDIFGQTLIITKGISNTIELSFDHLPSGIYFVQVGSSEKLTSFKIVKD